MKIMMPLFSRPLEYTELQIPVVVIENQSYFYKMVSDIHDQIEGREGEMILSDHGEVVLMKNADLIIDVFSLDSNQRKILSLLYKKLTEISTVDKYYSEVKELQRHINVFLQNITDELTFPIQFTEELQVMDLLKVNDVKFDFEDQTFSEALINYLSIMRDYGGKSAFFICNLKSWLGEESLPGFYKDIFYRKINVILLENHVPECKSDCEFYRIIDYDLCEIN